MARGVAIGAHVSYRDREGFGRRALDVAPDRLAADLVEQWETLVDEVGAVGGTVAYVKPHGALYNADGRRPRGGGHRRATPWVRRCRVLVGPPGGAHVAARPARPTWRSCPKASATAATTPTGCLVPRGTAGCPGRRPGRRRTAGPVAGRRRRGRRGRRHLGGAGRARRSASTATGPGAGARGPGRPRRRSSRPASRCGPSPADRRDGVTGAAPGRPTWAACVPLRRPRLAGGDRDVGGRPRPGRGASGDVVADGAAPGRSRRWWSGSPASSSSSTRTRDRADRRGCRRLAGRVTADRPAADVRRPRSPPPASTSSRSCSTAPTSTRWPTAVGTDADTVVGPASSAPSSRWPSSGSPPASPT